MRAGPEVRRGGAVPGAAERGQRCLRSAGLRRAPASRQPGGHRTFPSLLDSERLTWGAWSVRHIWSTVICIWLNLLLFKLFAVILILRWFSWQLCCWLLRSMFCTSVLSWKLPLFRFSYLYVGLNFPSRESVLRSWGSWGALAWMHLFEELFHLEALSALCLLVWAGWVTFIYGLLFETLFEDSSYNDQHTVFIEEWLKNCLILITVVTLSYHVYFTKTLKTVRTTEQILLVEMHNYSINKTVSVKADGVQVGHQ